MDAVLTIQHGAHAGRSFRLGRRVRVGRSPECEIRLPDTGVAAHHFVLEDRGEFFVLRDLGSGEGTFVDGTRVIAERLRDGATIFAGEAVLFFREGAANLPERVELEEAGDDLSNEVRRIYESSVTYLTDPDRGDEGRDAARTALSALYQVGRLAGGESDLGALFEGTARILHDALGADRTVVLLAQGDGRFRCVARAPGSGPASGADPEPTILNRATTEGISILIRDAGRDGRFSTERVGSVMCVPLKAARKVLGAIYCDLEPRERRFEEKDLRLATAVGRQAGGAIERRILEEQSYEVAQRLEQRVAERTRDLADALRELQEAQARLVLSEKFAAVGLLVQGIAHNMATPLSGILGTAQVLKARHPDLESLDEIVRLCRHLDGIIENLLLKGRHDAQTQPVPVDLDGVVEETLKFFEGDLFFKHEVTLRRDRAADLPPVWGVWSDFSQSLQNLIRNALDAMAASPRKILTVRTGANAGFLTIEVEDTGCGIAPADLPRLFDPFFSTKGEGGTGLGLFTVRNLLSPYGARIEARAVQDGTRFTIRIPRAIVKEGGEHGG